MSIKRIFAILLIVLISVQSVIINTTAEEPSVYHSDAMQNLVDLYFCNEVKLNALTRDDGFVYWGNANMTKSQKQTYWMFKKGSQILGEDYTKEDYAELLLYIITSNELCTAEMVEKMPQFDNPYDLEEFVDDMSTITGEVLAVYGDVLGLGKDANLIFNTSLDIVGDLPKLADNISANKKYLYMLLQQHVSNLTFLSAVYNNTDNKDLKDAADEMMRIEQQVTIKKMEYFKENIKSFEEFKMSIFTKDLMFPVLNEMAEEKGYKKLSSVTKFLGNIISFAFSEGKLTYDLLMTFVGNLTFGTLESYRRENEILALAEIASCISKECNKIEIDDSLSKTNHINIQKKLYYFNNLLTIHTRGEFTLYKALTNEMNIIYSLNKTGTDFKNYMKSLFSGTEYVKERPEKDWVNSQLKSFSEINTTIEKLKEQSQFIKDNSYVTGRVLYEDTRVGAFALLLFTSHVDDSIFTIVGTEKNGFIKGYVPPGNYKLTITCPDYQIYEEDVVITEDGTDIGKIWLKKEGESIINDEIVKSILEDYVTQKENMYGKTCTYTVAREVGTADNGVYLNGWWNGITPSIVLGYTIADFDNDTYSELLIITIDDAYLLQLDMYEVIDDEVKLVDSKRTNSDNVEEALALPKGRHYEDDRCGLLSCFYQLSDHRIFVQMSDSVSVLSDGFSTNIISLIYNEGVFTDYKVSCTTGSDIEGLINDKNLELMQLGVSNPDFKNVFYKLLPLVRCFDGSVHEFLRAEQHTTGVQTEDSIPTEVETTTTFLTMDEIENYTYEEWENEVSIPSAESSYETEGKTVTVEDFEDGFWMTWDELQERYGEPDSNYTHRFQEYYVYENVECLGHLGRLSCRVGEDNIVGGVSWHSYEPNAELYTTFKEVLSERYVLTPPDYDDPAYETLRGYEGNNTVTIMYSESEAQTSIQWSD